MLRDALELFEKHAGVKAPTIAAIAGTQGDKGLLDQALAIAATIDDGLQKSETIHYLVSVLEFDKWNEALFNQKQLSPLKPALKSSGYCYLILQVVIN